MNYELWILVAIVIVGVATIGVVSIRMSELSKRIEKLKDRQIYALGKQVEILTEINDSLERRVKLVECFNDKLVGMFELDLEINKKRQEIEELGD